MTPLPLRTVRPFIVDDVALEVAADEEGFELSDKMAITKFLKKKVEELIVRANEQWDERNARAVAEGEDELPRMLPLIRLKVRCFSIFVPLPYCSKGLRLPLFLYRYQSLTNTLPTSRKLKPKTQVDTTGVSEMSNPVRFGQEFQG